MAFDFPSNPAVGDEYSSGGATYTYTATGTWDLGGMNAPGDFVEKSGDTMTGTLFGTNIRAIGNGTVGQCWLSCGDTNRTGNIEWRMQDGARQAYMGWGLKSDWIVFKNEDACHGLYMSGADIYMGEGSGLHWGSTSAKTDVNDFSEGICLYGYGSTSQFGFNITSGTFNISVQNAVNKVDVNVGGATQLRVQQGTSHMYSNFSCAGTITSTVAANNTGLQFGDGVKIDLSNGCQMRKVYGSNQFQFHTNASQVFAFHISNTGDVFVIDTVGSTGNSYSATAPEALALGKELGVARRKPETETTLEGVDIVKMLAALLLKVKKMEAEIATLKGRR